MEIKIPELALVAMIGTSGSGKSTFARKHFKATEVLSSDAFRGWVSDDENNQAASSDAFEMLYALASKRLKNGLLTVIDATHVQKEARKDLIEKAREYHVLPVAIVLDMPPAVCEKRNKARADRNFGRHVVRQQHQLLKQSIGKLREEGFRQIYVLKSEEEVEQVTAIIREKLYTNKKELRGPFDFIGDVHGCFDELIELLRRLGYHIRKTDDRDEGNFGYLVFHEEKRMAVFVGDLVDRGPNSPEVLRLVMSMVRSGAALCVPGNHDVKFQRYLNGRDVQLKHGLDLTVQQFENESVTFKNAVHDFIDGLISHYVLDDGRIAVAHAGVTEEMQGRGSKAVREFCLYGETSGEIDDYGLPVRYNWARNYRGKAKVVFGHTPVPDPEWLNNTIDIDTGCVFGGKLTALRYPENQFVQVAAKMTYCEPSRPLDYNAKQFGLSAQQEHDDLLDIEDVIGRRIVQTRLRSNITLQHENSIAALEIMSRFAVNPKWLIYLPPTMAPCQTSELPDFLEHPIEALNYYKKHGIEKVICEEKHMGSRAIVVVCKDESAAVRRFGVENEGIGMCYTRTGRAFFNDKIIENDFLYSISDSLTTAGFWEKFNTEWVCLDAELMPWSAKAQSLLRDQYAATGAAALGALSDVEMSLRATVERGITGAVPALERFSTKHQAIEKYRKAYQNYCWPVNSLEDYKLAPFHILATEGQVHVDKTHEWHMEQIAAICAHNPPILMATPYKIVELQDEASVQSAIDWWLDLTQNGGEGMVVKPYDFIAYDGHDLIQPAVKCRGSEYLRIIYGPDYDMPELIERLKNRNLSRKMSLAMREFALGIEALERFVRKEPLRRIHESVFGVLALESEYVDPRL
jgi:protein phosphatase